MIEVFTLVLAATTLVVAVVGILFAWLNHRARKQGEMPKVWMKPLDHGYYRPDQVMRIYFQLKTHQANPFWRVSRVEVVDSTPQDCLRHAETGQGEWRDYDTFDNPIGPDQYGELDVRPGCNRLLLKFLCERPWKRLWMKGLTKQWVGPVEISWLLQCDETKDRPLDDQSW